MNQKTRKSTIDTNSSEHVDAVQRWKNRRELMRPTDYKMGDVIVLDEAVKSELTDDEDRYGFKIQEAHESIESYEIDKTGHSVNVQEGDTAYRVRWWSTENKCYESIINEKDVVGEFEA